MIRYTLKCKENHSFESWFQSAEAFEKLKSANMVSCAVCGCVNVEKAIMSPGVRPTRGAAKPPLETPPKNAPPHKGALSGQQSASEQALKDLRKKIEASAEDVGKEFVREARAIHEGDAPDRPIIGQARADEAQQLVQDGIPVVQLAWSSQKTN